MLNLVLAVLAGTPAYALTTNQSGPLLDVAAGLGVGAAPIAPGPSWLLGFGWWFGPYDDSYALGRYVALGVVARQELIGGTLRTAPLLELSRGIDVIVAGGNFGIGGGPVLTVDLAGDAGTAIGAAGRLHVGGEFRRSRFWGFTARLEGGADYVEGTISGAGSLLIGFQFSRPSHTIE